MVARAACEPRGRIPQEREGGLGRGTVLGNSMDGGWGHSLLALLGCRMGGGGALGTEVGGMLGQSHGSWETAWLSGAGALD